MDKAEIEKKNEADADKFAEIILKINYCYSIQYRDKIVWQLIEASKSYIDALLPNSDDQHDFILFFHRTISNLINRGRNINPRTWKGYVKKHITWYKKHKAEAREDLSLDAILEKQGGEI
jgi:hypothetical protein